VGRAKGATVKRGINEILDESRKAYAAGDKEKGRALWIEAFAPYDKRKKTRKPKGRSPGQARYVAMLKRNGWA
jgi:hypothetical protein